MEAFCKNHPEQVAKKKCFQCKAPICPTCQIQKSQHIFCSQSCYRLFIIHRLSSNQFGRFLQVKQKLIPYWEKLKKLPRPAIAFSLLALGLILSLMISLISICQVQKLKHVLEQRSAIIPPSDTTKTFEEIARHIDTLTVVSPPANALNVQNRITIEGKAEDNRVITLSVNGRLIQTTLIERGLFSFKNVLARPGQNLFVVRSINEDGSSVLIEEIKIDYGRPTPSFLERDFSRGNLDEKKIALTFDGDYLDNVTGEILDILKSEQVRCTIFLTGRFMRRYGDLVKRMVEEGHEIGDHSWTHPHLTTFEKNYQHLTLPEITPELLQQELLKTADLFRQITGKQIAPYWRAPYGEHNAEIRKWAAAVGFRHIGWTMGRSWDLGMDTLDWVADKSATTYHSADQIAEKILSFGRDQASGASGAIILMHLGTQRNDDYPHQKLSFIIQQLKIRGYQLVTISEML